MRPGRFVSGMVCWIRPSSVLNTSQVASVSVTRIQPVPMNLPCECRRTKQSSGRNFSSMVYTTSRSTRASSISQ